VAEKTNSLVDDKLLNDVLLPLKTSPTNEPTALRRDRTSFTDCLADVESNATDSENAGHVSDDDDDDNYNDYGNTVIDDDTLSSPLACSFHCIPPENTEKRTVRLGASSVDCSPASSPVGVKHDHCMSSEGEFSAALGNIRISDDDSCHSSCSFGGILYEVLSYVLYGFVLLLL